MERAANAFVSWFTRNIDNSGKFIFFAGPGNNGGDGMAVARILHERNYQVKAYLLRFTKKLSDDCQEEYRKTEKERGRGIF